MNRKPRYINTDAERRRSEGEPSASPYTPSGCSAQVLPAQSRLLYVRVGAHDLSVSLRVENSAPGKSRSLIWFASLVVRSAPDISARSRGRCNCAIERAGAPAKVSPRYLSPAPCLYSFESPGPIIIVISTFVHLQALLSRESQHLGPLGVRLHRNKARPAGESSRINEARRF